MPSQWLRNIGHKASAVRMLRPLYDAQLGKLDQVLDIQSTPIEPLLGDAGYGRWIASGQLDLHGHRVAMDTQDWWIGSVYEPTPFFKALHQFDFLRDLKALGGDAGRRAARFITGQWIMQFEKYSTVTWTPSLCAHRLVNWLATYEYAYATADDDFIEVLHSLIYKQYRHLDHCVRHESNMRPRIRFDCLWALVVVGTHIPQLKSDHYDSWVLLLRGAVEDLTYQDGGYVHRDLGQWVILSRQLTILKQSMVTTKMPVPSWLTKNLETGLRLLGIFMHGDKSLPNFHAGFGAGKNDVDRLVRHNHFRFRKTDTHLPQTGYSALRKGRSVVLISHNDGKHVSPNAFEFSHGSHPVIINCGSHLFDDAWRDSLTGMNAHSTMCINQQDPDLDMITPMKTDLEVLNGAVLWHGTHEGYRRQCQTVHTRRLYLDQTGEDLRGEDLIVRSIASKSINVILRFHLHPQVKVSPIHEGSAMMMQLPSGAGWMFEAAHCQIRVEPSVYTGRYGFAVQKTNQIILETDVAELSHTVKWALRRI